MLKLVQGILSVAVLLIIAYILIPLFIINENRIQNIANDFLGEDYLIQMSSVSWNPVQQTFSSDNIKIVYVDDDEIFLEIAELSIENIDLAAVFSGNLKAGNLVIDHFVLNLDKMPEANRESGDGDEREVTVSIDNISIQDGNVNFSDEEGGKGEITGIHARGSLNWDSTCDECEYYDIFSDIHLDIGEVKYLTGNGLYRLEGSEILVDEAQSGMEISEVRLVRLYNDQELREKLEFRQDYFDVEISGVRINHIRFDKFRENRDILLEELFIEKAELHVTSDHNLPEDPEKDPSDMPHDALEKIPFRLSIEKLNLEHGDFRYSEYDRDSVRPGSILFARTTAETTRIDNRADDPITVISNSYVMDQGQLDVTFLLQMGQEELDLNVKGNAGELDLTLLNEIFLDLEGILIEDGKLHHIAFEYDMRSENASGVLDIIYTDLSIDVVDRENQGQNLVNVIEGFFADRIVVRSGSSSASGESREGEISENRDPDSGFFNYLWSSFRSGLFDAVKRF